MKEACDKNKVCAAILTDLSKALTLLTLKHDLLIAKLHACGFYYKSLIVMLEYLNNSVQGICSYYGEILDIFWCF